MNEELERAIDKFADDVYRDLTVAGMTHTSAAAAAKESARAYMVGWKRGHADAIRTAVEAIDEMAKEGTAGSVYAAETHSNVPNPWAGQGSSR